MSHAVYRSNTHLVLAVWWSSVADPVPRVTDLPFIVLCHVWHNARISRSPDAKLTSILKAWRIMACWLNPTSHAADLYGFVRTVFYPPWIYRVYRSCMCLHVDVPPARVIGIYKLLLWCLRCPTRQGIGISTSGLLSNTLRRSYLDYSKIYRWIIAYHVYLQNI